MKSHTKVTKKIKYFLGNNGFIESVIKVGSGNLIGQIIAVITTPILSRIYNDVAYGDRLLIVSTASIICSFSTLGLNSAIMAPKDNDEAKKVFTTAFYVNVIVSVLISIFCLVLSGFFKLFIVSGSYSFSILILFLYLLGNTTNSLMLIYTNRKGRYNRLFLTPIIGSIINIALAIPLGLIGCGYEGLLLTVILANFIQIFHMAWKDIPIIHPYTINDFVFIIRKYKDYVIYQYPSNFIKNSGNEYPTQFLGRNFGSEELGNYSMCLNTLKYPIRLIASPISTVYFRTATEFHRQGKNVADFTYKIISRIFIISFVPVIICCIFSEKIFTFVLGNNWSMAGTIAAIKATEYVMLFCNDCVSYCRVIIGKQKSNLLFSLIKLITVIFFSTIGFNLYHDLIKTIATITIGNTLLNIFDMGLNFYHLDRNIQKKYYCSALLYTMLIAIIIYCKYKLELA